MKDYATYLFDADGTLIDTAEMIHRCFVYTLGRFGGRIVTRAQVIASMGLPLRRSMESFLGPLTEERYETVRKAHMEYQLSIFSEHLRVFPTVVEGLRALKERGKTLGIVTSRMRETLDLYLRHTGLYDFFDLLLTPADSTRHKPDPEPVVRALEILKAPAQTAIYTGDAEYDIECGAGAGVDTAFVLWSESDPATFKVKPTAVIGSIMELAV